MPNPKKDESKKEFISRAIPIIISDAKSKGKTIKPDQATAIAASMYDRFKEKQSRNTSLRVCRERINVRSSDIKEKSDDGEFFSEGFIMTTHIDRANEGQYKNTCFSLKCLEQSRDAINDNIVTLDFLGSPRMVSDNHDWLLESEPHKMPAGDALPPAEIREMDEGHYGLWVKTHHNRNHPEFESIKYDVEHGYIPGYSIEFKEGSAREINVEGRTVKQITDFEYFIGYGFADARTIAQPEAAIAGCGYREIQNAVEIMEESKMAEEEVKKDVPIQEEAPEVKEEPVEEVSADESEEEEVSEEEEPSEEKPEEPSSRNAKFDIGKLADNVVSSPQFREAIKKVGSEHKKLNNVGGSTMDVNIRQMKDAMKAFNAPQIRSAVGSEDMTHTAGEVSYRNAAINYMQSQRDKGEDILEAAVRNMDNYTIGFQSNLNIRTAGKGLVISDKVNIRGTLGVGDNTSAYTQSNVEFADVFAPGIIDTFNNQIALFGFLKKEQHVGGNYYQWKIITNRDPASNSTFVAQNDVTIKKNFSSKLNLQTPLKIARRGVSVTDFINRYSARSLGDLFMLETDIQMNEMMKDVNISLYAENSDGDSVSPLGLEAVADSAGNTTIYGTVRSATNRLAPTAAADTYLALAGSVTEGAMRRKLSYLETEGTKKGSIAIVTSPTGRDFLFNLLDGNRRFNTTEAMFGFNRMNVPSYDGIPIIVDTDCDSAGTAPSTPSAAIYFIDTDADVIVVGMAPQFIDLAKVGAAKEAYLQMDFAHVYKEPRRIGMLDTVTGPAA